MDEKLQHNVDTAGLQSMTTLPLRQLEAQLERVVTIISSEIETEQEGCIGLYVHRGSDDGQKYKWGPRPESYEFHPVATVAEADHVMFLCPECFAKNGGAVGTHRVFVTFAGRTVADEAGSRDSTGKPSRWAATGTTIDDLVLTPSILVGSGRPADQGCHWHGFVGSSGIPAGHAG